MLLKFLSLSVRLVIALKGEEIKEIGSKLTRKNHNFINESCTSRTSPGIDFFFLSLSLLPENSEAPQFHFTCKTTGPLPFYLQAVSIHLCEDCLLACTLGFPL